MSIIGWFIIFIISKSKGLFQISQQSHESLTFMLGQSFGYIEISALSGCIANETMHKTHPILIHFVMFF